MEQNNWETEIVNDLLFLIGNGNQLLINNNNVLFMNYLLLEIEFNELIIVNIIHRFLTA